jgi:hypothetical protein
MLFSKDDGGSVPQGRKLARALTITAQLPLSSLPSHRFARAIPRQLLSRRVIIPSALWPERAMDAGGGRYYAQTAGEKKHADHRQCSYQTACGRIVDWRGCAHIAIHGVGPLCWWKFGLNCRSGTSGQYCFQEQPDQEEVVLFRPRPRNAYLLRERAGKHHAKNCWL